MKTPIDFKALANPWLYNDGKQSPHFVTRYYAAQYADDDEIVTLRRWPGVEPFYMVLPLPVWKKFQGSETDPYGERT